MKYTFDWHTHDDKDELDYFLRDSLAKSGYDVDELGEAELEEVCQSFARPFYETTWNVTLDTETNELVVNSIDDRELNPPLVLREGIADAAV